MTIRPSYYNNGTRAVMLATALILLPAQASAHHEVITTLSDGMECRMTTFENGPDFQPIHPESNYLIEGSGMRFPGWYTYTTNNK